MAFTIAKTFCKINFCTNGMKHHLLSKSTPSGIQSSSVLKEVYRSAWYRSFFGSDQSTTKNPSKDIVTPSVTTEDAGPFKPKKPANAFIVYLQTVQDGIKKANPVFKRREIITEAANRWKDLNPEEKSKIAMERKELYEKYKVDKAHYLENRTPDQIKEEEKEKDQKRNKKLKKARKSLGMPARPWSSYKWFLSEKFSERTEEPVQNFFKQAKDQWNSLSESERNKYIQKHLQSKQVYEKEMADWEESMIEEGQFSVIRKTTLDKLKTAEGQKRTRQRTNKVIEKGSR